MTIRFVDALGLRVRVIETGQDAARTPVVLLHGAGGWAESWAEVLDPIAATGRRVIAIDLPGFGASDPPKGAGYFEPADQLYARVIHATLASLGITGGAHIVGNSLGGAVAYTVAVTAPSSTRSLVLVASAGLGSELAFGLRLLTLPGSEIIARIPWGKAATRWLVRPSFHDPSRIPAHLFDEAFAYGRHSFRELARVLRSVADLGGVRPALRRYWLARASAFSGPVLGIWGRQDSVLPIVHARTLPTIFPRIQMSLIEGCGHMPHAERTDEFLMALIPFLERADGEHDRRRARRRGATAVVIPPRRAADGGERSR